MKVDLPVYSSKQIGQDVGSPSCCTKDGGSDPLQVRESDFDHFFQLMKLTVLCLCAQRNVCGDTRGENK